MPDTALPDLPTGTPAGSDLIPFTDVSDSNATKNATAAQIAALAAAPAASAVSFAPAGGTASTDVQGAIEEVRTELQSSIDGKLASSHEGSGGAVHADATAYVAGFMSGADKTKLDALAEETVVTEAGATRTMADADAGRTVRCTAACEVTVPSGLTAGVTTTYVAEHASGAVTFVGSGLTLRFAATFSAASREQWAAVVVRILDTDEALLTGVLADA